MSSANFVLGRLCVLLLFYDYAACLIIPEELPTILSLIYSNIPPVKKGTDSRIGVGFRLGEHADFQMLLELGPQTRTDPIGNAASTSKRRRDAMFGAAMRGELGPLAQAVAKYQLERKVQKEIERLKKLREKVEATSVEESDDKKTPASKWLTNWRKEMLTLSENRTLAVSDDVLNEKGSSSSTENETVQRIGRPPPSNGAKSTISDLKKFYVLRSDEKASDPKQLAPTT